MEITTEQVDKGWLISVVGEVDVHTADELRQAIVRVEGDGQTIRINLAGVEFMDSTGLGVLIGALTRSKEKNSRLVLTQLSARVERLLVLTGMDEQFEISAR